MRWIAALPLLFATPAFAAPQCAMHGPTAMNASIASRSPTPSPSVPAPPMKPTLLPSALADIAFAKHVAAAGAKVSDLGSIHGLRMIAARSGSQFMIFEIASDNQAAVSGVPIDLTVAQLQSVASSDITDLGEAHGFHAYFVRSGQQFQVFYATPDGQGLIPGVLWDASGKDITRQQVARIPGSVPTPTRRSSQGGCSLCFRRRPTAQKARPRRRVSSC